MWIFQFLKSKSAESKRPRISFFFYLFVSFVFSATKQNAKKRNKWEDKNVENGPEVRLRFRPSPPSLALKFQISVRVRERERENSEFLNYGKLFIYRSSTEELDEILWKNRNKLFKIAVVLRLKRHCVKANDQVCLRK